MIKFTIPNNLFGVSGIYLIRHKITGKSYVGQARDIGLRWQGHLQQIGKRKFHITSALSKYGPSAFDWSVIEFCQEDQLHNAEIKWIEKLGVDKNGYNHRSGGQGGRLSKSTRNKISKAVSARSKELWTDGEYRRKVLPSLLKAQKSELRKKRAAEARLEPSFDKKVKDGLINSWSCPERRQKATEAFSQLTWYHNPFTGETLRLKSGSEIPAGFIVGRNFITSNATGVICDGVYFPSYSKAAKAYNVSQATIMNRVKSKNFPNFSLA